MTEQQDADDEPTYEKGNDVEIEVWGEESVRVDQIDYSNEGALYAPDECRDLAIRLSAAADLAESGGHGPVVSDGPPDGGLDTGDPPAVWSESDPGTGESVLEEADRIGDERGEEYGDPSPNMEAIARLWSGYLRNLPGWSPSADPLGPEDAAQMMILLKMARFQTGEPSRDHFTDEAGYARVTAEVLGVNGGD